LSDQIEKNETREACGTYGGQERFVWWIDLREEPRVGPRHREEDNNKMDLQEAGLGGME